MLGEDSVQTHNCNTNILLSIVGRDLPRDAERQEVRADHDDCLHPSAASPGAAAGQPPAGPGELHPGPVRRPGHAGPRGQAPAEQAEERGGGAEVSRPLQDQVRPAAGQHGDTQPGDQAAQCSPGPVRETRRETERCFSGSGRKQLWTENLSIYCNNLCK